MSECKCECVQVVPYLHHLSWKLGDEWMIFQENNQKGQPPFMQHCINTAMFYNLYPPQEGMNTSTDTKKEMHNMVHWLCNVQRHITSWIMYKKTRNHTNHGNHSEPFTAPWGTPFSSKNFYLCIVGTLLN